MSDTKEKDADALSKITKDRSRSNLLKSSEQKLLAFLVQRIPSCISSNMLTAIGFVGSIITFLSFVLATYVHRYLLLFSILGFAINWFGDSLDGRVAYYRSTPRKWYGFSLDLTVDWLTTMLIGAGFVVYTEGYWKLVGVAFVLLYGWEMITALLRYKVTNKYTIDSGIFGPTEVRLLLSTIFITEVFFSGTIGYVGSVACFILLIANLVDFTDLLKMADARDKEEQENKT